MLYQLEIASLDTEEMEILKQKSDVANQLKQIRTQLTKMRLRSK